MKYTDLQAIFRNIATRHKAIEIFKHGLQSDDDPASINKYPAIYMRALSVTPIIEPGKWINNWAIQFLIADQLTQDRHVDEVIGALNKSHQIMEEVMLELECNFGELDDVKDVSYTNDRDEKITATPHCNFTISGTQFSFFIDDKVDNLTGFEATFTLTERIKRDICCLDEKFD